MRTTLVFLTLVSAACGSQPTTLSNNNPAPQKTWSASVTNITEYTRLDGSLYYYTPDAGYVWAKMQVSMTNLEASERCLNWLEDGFDYIHKGATYNQHLEYESDIDWYLPKCYLPNQTKSGYVVFELPDDGTVSGDVAELREGVDGLLDGTWFF